MFHPKFISLIHYNSLLITWRKEKTSRNDQKTIIDDNDKRREFIEKRIKQLEKQEEEDEKKVLLHLEDLSRKFIPKKMKIEDYINNIITFKANMKIFEIEQNKLEEQNPSDNSIAKLHEKIMNKAIGKSLFQLMDKLEKTFPKYQTAILIKNKP